MNNEFKSQVKKYIKEIKSLLFCDSKHIKMFIKDFKNDLYEYIDENAITDMDKIVSHFGTPEEVAKEFFENADLKSIRKRIRIKNILAIGVAICILIWAVALTAEVIDSHRSVNGYIVEYPVVEIS